MLLRNFNEKKSVAYHFVIFTGKSFSEVLILGSTNPQYNKRLSIELPVQCMKIPSSEHCQNMLCTQIVLNVKTKTTKPVIVVFNSPKNECKTNYIPNFCLTL